jgi:hypothetical protein
MIADTECTVNVEPATSSQPGIYETIPVDMRSQITTMLASMILSQQEEVAP